MLSSALGLGRDPGCGGAESPSSGVNAPCTRSKDCGAGLVCMEGVCTEPDAGTSSGVVPDSGTSGTSGSDSGSARDAADDGS